MVVIREFPLVVIEKKRFLIAFCSKVLVTTKTGYYDFLPENLNAKSALT